MDVVSAELSRVGTTSRIAVAGLLLSVLSAGCDRVPAIANTRASSMDVASAVVGAIESRDRPALDTFALDETEFRNHVWPALPAARPERNLPFSYVWGDLRQKSQASLHRTLKRHGGRRYTLLGVRFGGKTDYGSYTVHHASTLRVRDQSGAEEDIRVFGSLIEQGGAWKVFSYVVDD